MLRTLFFTCTLLLSLQYVSGQTCYFPDGTIADLHVPCGHGSQACCYYLDDSHHDLCFSNGFCFSWFFGSLYRGSCTDKSFSDSSGCATECLTSRSLTLALLQRSANGLARNLQIVRTISLPCTLAMSEEIVAARKTAARLAM